MSVFNINVEGNTAVRLTTAGKYCDRDIVVTPEDLTENLSEQGSLIAQIQTALAEKCVPSAGLPTQEKTVEITENGEFDIVPDDGYTLSKVALTVKVSGDSGDDDLPTGYRRCDFIQFNGSNMVDTGIIGDQDTQIFASFTWENSNQRYLLGCAHADNTAAITAYMNGSWRFGDKVASKSFSLKNPMLPFSALLNNTTIGSTSGVTAISGVNDFETIGTLLFGACRSSNGSVPSTGIVGKGFRLVIWKHGERVLELIPVTDGSAYRFWDVIGRKFYDSVTSTPLDGGNW